MLSIHVATGACSAEQADPEKSGVQHNYQSEVDDPQSQSSGSHTLPATANTAGTDGAQDTPRYVVTDNDEYWIHEAETACRNSEFKSFFEAFVRSVGVRNRYTRDPIILSTKDTIRQVPRSRYFDFPIAMSDHRFISKNTENGEPDVEFLRLTFNQSQSDKYRIDWVRVRYAGNGDDREGEAEIIGTFGLPGYLIFEPTENCWQLIEDSVYEGRYEGNLGYN